MTIQELDKLPSGRVLRRYCIKGINSKLVIVNPKVKTRCEICHKENLKKTVKKLTGPARTLRVYCLDCALPVISFL